MGTETRRMSGRDAIDHMNQKTYQDRKVTADYAATQALQPPEATILAQLGPAVRGRRILDIGVGGGRTLPFLTALSPDYVGVDYSPEMVRACQANFPTADLRVGDARSLDFPEGHFHLVFFSFNGIDYVPHADRQQILRELHRVLAPGGYLVFSSHNETWRRSPHNRPKRTIPRRPHSLLKWAVLELIGQYRHARNQQFEVHGDAYSIINDLTHNYRLMTYFVTIEEQVAQLQAAGFRVPVRAFELEGRETTYNDTSPWIYYCAQKG